MVLVSIPSCQKGEINLNKRVQVADRKRFEFPKRITRGYHLLDPRWNELFLIICQKVFFYPLGNRTRVPIIAMGVG